MWGHLTLSKISTSTIRCIRCLLSSQRKSKVSISQEKLYWFFTLWRTSNKVTLRIWVLHLALIWARIPRLAPFSILSPYPTSNNLGKICGTYTRGQKSSSLCKEFHAQLPTDYSYSLATPDVKWVLPLLLWGDHDLPCVHIKNLSYYKANYSLYILWNIWYKMVFLGKLWNNKIFFKINIFS